MPPTRGGDSLTTCLAGPQCQDPYAPRYLPLCEACLDAAERDVRALVYDYADLEQRIPRADTGGEPISGTREPVLPLDLGILGMQRAIWLQVTAGEAIVRDIAGLPSSASEVREGFAVQRAVQILAPRLRLLANADSDLTSGAAIILELTRLHAAVRARLGLNRLVHELAGQCPDCRARGLRRDDGSDTVHCTGCAFRCAWDDYRRCAIDWIRHGDDDWLPPARAAEVAAVSVATLRVWRARGRLSGRRHSGGWLYRHGDLVALKASDQA